MSEFRRVDAADWLRCESLFGCGVVDGDRVKYHLAISFKDTEKNVLWMDIKKEFVIDGIAPFLFSISEPVNKNKSSNGMKFKKRSESGIICVGHDFTGNDSYWFQFLLPKRVWQDAT